MKATGSVLIATAALLGLVAPSRASELTEIKDMQKKILERLDQQESVLKDIQTKLQQLPSGEIGDDHGHGLVGDVAGGSEDDAGSGGHPGEDLAEGDLRLGVSDASFQSRRAGQDGARPALPVGGERREPAPEQGIE